MGDLGIQMTNMQTSIWGLGFRAWGNSSPMIESQMDQNRTHEMEAAFIVGASRDLGDRFWRAPCSKDVQLMQDYGYCCRVLHGLCRVLRMSAKEFMRTC